MVNILTTHRRAPTLRNYAAQMSPVKLKVASPSPCRQQAAVEMVTQPLEKRGSRPPACLEGSQESSSSKLGVDDSRLAFHLGVPLPRVSVKRGPS